MATNAKNRLRGACAVLLLVMAGSVMAAGKTYRWVDANGKVHYGDQPPPNATAVTEKPAGAAPAVDDGAKAGGTDAAECERRTQKLNQYRNAAAVTETDSLGNKREYTEAERQKLVERAEQSVRDGGCAQ